MTSIGNALAAIFAALQTPAAPTPGPLTLDEAVQIGQRNAFAVRLQQATVEQNRQQVALSRAGLGPTVSSTTTYTRYPSAVTSNFGGASIVVQPADVGSTGASLSLPIDISGNLHRQVNASRWNQRASQFTLQADYNDTRLNVRNAYLAVLRAQALIGVAQDALKDAQERLAQARLQYAAQQIARIDVLQYEAQVASAQADLIADQNALELANQQFNLALVRPIETPVNLVDITGLPDVTADPAQLVSLAQDHRPEVLAGTATLNALANTRRAEEAGMNPSLAVGLNYSRNLNPQGFGSAASTTTGTLTLNLPIFDSGATRARVREARQQEEQARIQLEQVRLGISQEIRAALTNLGNAKARLTNAEAQVSYAAEVYRLATIRRDAGEGTYVEVVDALSQLTTARNQAVSARYDYLGYFAALQRAVGEDDVAAAARGVVPNATTGTGGTGPGNKTDTAPATNSTKENAKPANTDAGAKKGKGGTH